MFHLNKYYLCIASLSSLSLMVIHPAIADTESNSKVKKEVMDLGAVVVTWAPNDSDEVGYENVYARDVSSVYRGKAELDRAKGLSPADMLKGMTGVYSGDSRNSGALDVNIRGIQGQGRVPVTIDGTEQSISVYRGYFGVSNRNYLDPSLISSITVEKGGSLSTDVKTSVGGGVAMKTLGIDDVVAKDEKFGIDFTMDTGTNTTRPRLPDLSPLGTDYRDSPDKIGGRVETHPNLLRDPKKRGKSSDMFNLKDGSFRIATGYRGEIFDLMGAISYRKQGNYFSGKRSASSYYQNVTDNNVYMPNVADIYAPGSEVLNTSSENRSFLLKNTWYLPDDQRLLLSARHSIIEHGELMPSRIIRYSDGGIQQWPIGKINQRAYSAQYKWNPEDNPWIDTNINLWKTITNSRTYTGAGYVFDLETTDWMWDWCRGQNGGDVSTCDRDDKSHIYKNTSLAHAKDNRWGITANNTMIFWDNLKFTAGIDHQKEKLRSDTKTREGRRRETNLMFNFEWQPISSVTINAGVRRNSYSSFDDRLAEGRRNQESDFARKNLSAIKMTYDRVVSQDEYSFYNKTEDMYQKMTPQEQMDWWVNNREDWAKYFKLKEAITGNKGKIREDFIYSQREDGRYYQADNPHLNGTVSKNKVINPVTGEEVDEYTYFSSQQHSLGKAKDQFAAVKKKRGHAWSPVFSIGWDMTDNSRLYARYAEDKRFPSMFEDTVGFTTGVRDFVTLKPEKSRNIEFGYIYDLSWLPNVQAADIKLSYYDMKLNNVIERDVDMFISQIDEQRSKGLELQARYSDGKYFANAGVNYNLKNKTCDESSSMALDPTGNFPRCVDGGFPIGFLRTSMVPKYSFSLTLGGKFFGDKLEATTSLNYHSKARNKQEKEMFNSGRLQGMDNNPIRWNSALLVDASLSYKVDKNFTLTFSGHNLTNQYYIDPLTRSFMPAPGRTFRIGFTGHF
ncbi:TonB-dependent receptor domain-containing protein [Wohlfahrtiimonas larvae]|uniref:TonB-dependent receptor n=1 Tax=Wohlfahrtiimonas larvae TaxID=1157986 RepID=A0ABP9MJA9_9GAMM|nr:TonB-dependent receptor [Wohlfahrtiimonas larvae]